MKAAEVPGPNPSIIQKLEEALEAARTGELTVVPMITTPAGKTYTSAAGNWSEGEVLWATESWKFRMLKRAYDD